MLEIPEAVVVSRQLNQTVKGKRIQTVIAAASPHKFAFYFGEPSEYDALLRGRTVENAYVCGGRIEMDLDGAYLQFGDIQPIGGVTYKIEGFFDLCRERGLTGSQGVIIPKQNIKDLCLKDDVINAVSENTFHIYAISHADEGIEILTGVKAGKKNQRGKFPADTVHGLVMKKLKEYYRKAAAEA